MRGHFQNLAGWLTSVLQAGLDQGHFRMTNPPENEAQTLMACIYGAMLSARAFGDPELFRTIVGPQVARLQA